MSLQRVSSSTSIAIIGGGIGGCALAALLQQFGFTEVKVYEKDERFSSRNQGYGLTIQQANSTLEELGLYDRIKEMDTPSVAHYTFSSTGKILGFFGRALLSPSEPSDSSGPPRRFNVHLPRQTLRRELFTRISDGTFLWNKKLLKAERGTAENDGKVLLSFEDGSQGTAQVVVGADGIFSKVRQYFRPSDPKGKALQYLGIIVILGIGPSTFPQTYERTVDTVDGVTRLFMMPFEKDVLMWQISFRVPEEEAKRLSSSRQLLFDAVYERCGQWHYPIPEILRSTPVENVTGYPVYDVPEFLPSFADPPFVLLGDAAHPMSPFKGQGANQALLDALSLATALKSYAPLSEALEAYSKEALRRCPKKVLGSRDQVDVLHSPAVFHMAERRGVRLDVLEELNRRGIVVGNNEFNLDEEILKVKAMNLEAYTNKMKEEQERREQRGLEKRREKELERKKRSEEKKREVELLRQKLQLPVKRLILQQQKEEREKKERNEEENSEEERSEEDKNEESK